MTHKKMADVVRLAKELGTKKVKLEDIPVELLVDGLANYRLTRRSIEDDPQIMGVFYHYHFQVGDLEIHLESRRLWITEEEAKVMQYTGLGLEEVRKLKRR